MSDNDATLGAVLSAVDTLVRQVPWTVKPAEEHGTAQQWADFVEECMGDMSQTWEEFISEVFSMLVYGHSIFEILYKPRTEAENSVYTDGRIGWRKFEIRAQDSIERWEFDVDGGIQGYWQRLDRGGSVLIPIEKSLLFRTKSHKGNPEGRSLLRNGYRSWYLLKRLEEIEAIGFERNLAGMPILQVPPQLMNPNIGGDSGDPCRRTLRDDISE
jgi:hypothetical protein